MWKVSALPMQISLTQSLNVTPLIPKDCATIPRDEHPVERKLWEAPVSHKTNSATPVCHFALLLQGENTHHHQQQKNHTSDFFWLKLGIQKAVFINESY